MRIVKQSFYDDFECIADKCPDTCCQGWEIDIDEDTLEYYRNYEGPLKERINKCVNFEDSCFRITKEMRCTMLTPEGLCYLVREHGEESLCNTCHMFPRHVEEYDGVREWSMTISCPEAAYTTITQNEPASYVYEENDDPEPLFDDFDDFDYLLYTFLEDSRDVIYDIVHNRNYPIADRMNAVLSMSIELQQKIEEDDVCDMDSIIEKYTNYECCTKDDIIDKYMHLSENTSILYEFEHLRVAWSDVLADLTEFIKLDKDKISEIYDSVNKEIAPYDREIILENLLSYFLYIYYLGAVYDDMIYPKTAMCVMCTLMIDYLFMCEVYYKKLPPTMRGYANMAYRFAREIEHSDVNLNMLEDYCENLFKL